MAYYLGITYKQSHPAAALLKDDTLVAAAEEERFNRIKGGGKVFPKLAVQWCAKQAGIKLSDIDHIGVCWDFDIHKQEFQQLYWLNRNFFPVPYYAHTHDLNYELGIPIVQLEEEFRADLRMLLGKDIKYHALNHHACHQASTFFGSEFQKANILTIDGRGEKATTTLAIGDASKLEQVHAVELPHSLGLLWQGVTMILGWTANVHEGKTMGLSSYGKPEKFKKAFDKIVLKTPEAYKINLNFQKYYNMALLDYFKPRPKEVPPINDYYEHIAAGLQEKTEEIAGHMVDVLHEKTGYKNLCLAGGVALNSVMNGKLLRNDHVKDIYIIPAAGDDGAAIGAAMLLYNKITGKRPKPFISPYTGPGYSDEEIESTLKLFKLKYERHKDIAGVAAEKMAKRKIVGWFQGRLEIGPRALGNRSILANPDTNEMKDTVNHFVKKREGWRPFALSMVEEKKQLYLDKPYTSPYMILTFDILKDKVKDLQAGVHVDGTTRPQTVTKEMNPIYYDLLMKFGKLTGTYAFVNTSMNIANEPLINNPEEAIRCFYGSGIDYMALGPFLLEK